MKNGVRRGREGIQQEETEETEDRRVLGSEPRVWNRRLSFQVTLTQLSGRQLVASPVPGLVCAAESTHKGESGASYFPSSVALGD